MALLLDLGGFLFPIVLSVGLRESPSHRPLLAVGDPGPWVGPMRLTLSVRFPAGPRVFAWIAALGSIKDRSSAVPTLIGELV